MATHVHNARRIRFNIADILHCPDHQACCIARSLRVAVCVPAAIGPPNTEISCKAPFNYAARANARATLARFVSCISLLGRVLRCASTLVPSQILVPNKDADTSPPLICSTYKTDTFATFSWWRSQD